MENEKKKRIYSAIQPTGTLNIGGYLGAVKNWIDFQDEYECIYTIADLHSLTVRNDPARRCSPAVSTPRKAGCFSRATFPSILSSAGLSVAIQCSENSGE